MGVTDYEVGKAADKHDNEGGCWLLLLFVCVEGGQYSAISHLLIFLKQCEKSSPQVDYKRKAIFRVYAAYLLSHQIWHRCMH